MEEKLRTLKVKKALLFSEIEMMHSCSDLLYAKFGKTQAEIMKIEKQLVRAEKNIFDED